MDHILDSNIVGTRHHLSSLNALIMDSGSPHCPEPDPIICDVLRYHRLAIPERIIWILMVNTSHNLNTRTSVVLNRINWCMSQLLTRGVIRLAHYPRWFGLPSDGVGTKGAN